MWLNILVSLLDISQVCAVQTFSLSLLSPLKYLLVQLLMNAQFSIFFKMFFSYVPTFLEYSTLQLSKTFPIIVVLWRCFLHMLLQILLQWIKEKESYMSYQSIKNLSSLACWPHCNCSIVAFLVLDVRLKCYCSSIYVQVYSGLHVLWPNAVRYGHGFVCVVV